MTEIYGFLFFLICRQVSRFNKMEESGREFGSFGGNNGQNIGRFAGIWGRI